MVNDCLISDIEYFAIIHDNSWQCGKDCITWGDSMWELTVSIIWNRWKKSADNPRCVHKV